MSLESGERRGLVFVHLLQVCRREGAGLSEEKGRRGGR